MGTTYNTRAFNAIHEEQSSLATIWDGQVWDLDLWALPTGSDNSEAAYDFLAFATSPSALASQMAYGPPRQSAQALVGTHVELGIDMKPFIPTSPVSRITHHQQLFESPCVA